MQVESSITMTPAEPAIVPAAASASGAHRRSSASGPRIGDEAPPGITALRLRPAGTPPPSSSIRCPIVSLMGIS